MTRSYTYWWLALLAIGVTVELVAIRRAKPGDTLSEHVWALLVRPEGALVFAVLAWCFLWHFPFGRGRRLGWMDLVAVLAGIAWWAIARRAGGR